MKFARSVCATGKPVVGYLGRDPQCSQWSKTIDELPCLSLSLVMGTELMYASILLERVSHSHCLICGMGMYMRGVIMVQPKRHSPENFNRCKILEIPVACMINELFTFRR